MYALLKTLDPYTLRNFIHELPEERIFSLQPTAVDTILGKTPQASDSRYTDYVVYIRDIETLDYIKDYACLAYIGKTVDLIPNAHNIVCTRHYSGGLGTTSRNLAEIEKCLLNSGYMAEVFSIPNGNIVVNALVKPFLVQEINNALATVADPRRASFFCCLDLRRGASGMPSYLLYHDPRQGKTTMPLFVPKNETHLRVEYVDKDTRHKFPWLDIGNVNSNLVLLVSFNVKLLTNFLEDSYGLIKLVNSGIVPYDSNYATSTLQFDAKFLADNPTVYTTGKTYVFNIGGSETKLTVKKLTLPSGIVDCTVETSESIKHDLFEQSVGKIIDTTNSKKVQKFLDKR